MSKLSAGQIETLDFLARNRCKKGVYTIDAHEEATTFASLRRRRLIGYYATPRQGIARRYKITPAGRAALSKTLPSSPAAILEGRT